MSTVLITGLNGFVAVHAAVVYLKNGWSVRGTVRSQDKADKVKALSAFKDYPGKVEVVIIKDLIEGDYTEALKGVDAIAHCASPWHFKGESWASYRDPAVKGTTNLLEQAAKVSSIKAVSLMSSFASIGDFSSPPEKQKDRTYTEKDWSPLTEEQCEGEGASPMMWYPASKKFAELAAFEVQKKTGNTFTLGTVCPPLILGPAIHIDSATGEELADVDVSTSSIYKAIAAGKDAEIPDTAFPIYGDVRNVADALFAIVDKKADGRFAICNGLYDFQQLANRAREIAPQYVESIPVGKPNELVSQKGCYTLDASKAERELGIKYISEDQMIKDVLEQFAAIGAIKA